MTYEHLLHDFIDGALDYQGELMLFSELRANDALRRELKLLMMMQKSAAHDVEAYTPAPDSHEVIFRRLGFTSGLAEPSPGGYGPLNGFLRRHAEGMIGALAGALLMALVMFGVDRFSPRYDGTPRSASSLPAASALPPVHHDTLFLHDAAASEEPRRIDGAPADGASANGSLPRTGSYAAPRPYRPARSGGRNDAMLAEGTAHHDGTAAPRSVAIDRAELLGAPLHGVRETSPASSLGSPAALHSVALPRPEGDADDLLPFSVGYRAMNGRDFTPPPTGLVTPSNGLLRDRALSGFYSIGNGRAVGVEIGQEAFYQRFEERVASGDIVRHEQAPALLWGGIALRQTFGDVGGVRPFAGTLLGGTRVGPVGRLSLGASYDVTTDISLMAGGDVSALAYRFGGSWYLSPKYALTYGLSVRF